MSRTYEFLEDRMKFMNKELFAKYYETEIKFQFKAKVTEIPKVKRAYEKEENQTIKEMLSRPVVTVTAKCIDENKYKMTWSVGFEGMNMMVDSFIGEEELYSLEEIANVAMWKTHLNLQDLNWSIAIKKLKK